MADQTSFTIEQQLIASVWVHERDITGKTIEDFRNDFQSRFNLD